MLWGLDGFFLHQEKLFRELYDEVADGTIDSTVFTLKTKNIKHPDKVDSYFKCLFSKTLRSFHGILSIVIVIVAIIIA